MLNLAEICTLSFGTVLDLLAIHVNKFVDGDANTLMSQGVGNQMRALKELYIMDNQLTEDGNLRYFQVTWEIVVGMFLKNVGHMCFGTLGFREFV